MKFTKPRSEQATAEEDPFWSFIDGRSSAMPDELSSALMGLFDDGEEVEEGPDLQQLMSGPLPEPSLPSCLDFHAPADVPDRLPSLGAVLDLCNIPLAPFTAPVLPSDNADEDEEEDLYS